MEKLETVTVVDYLKAYQLACHNMTIFVSDSGYYNSTGCGYWHAKQWQDVEEPEASYTVFSLGLFEDKGTRLIAGGYTNSNYMIVPCYWKNGELFELALSNDFVKFQKGTAHDICVNNGDVIAGGYVEKSLGRRLTQACLWINGSLSLLTRGDGSPFTYSRVFKVYVHNGDCYAIGMISDNGRESYAGYWKNSQWVEIEKGPYLKIRAEAIGYDKKEGELVVVGSKTLTEGLQQESGWMISGTHLIGLAEFVTRLICVLVMKALMCLGLRI